MKMPLHVVLARRERAARLLSEHQYLPISELAKRLGVSVATARRDLVALAGDRQITRTYGGALSDFNSRFPSFRYRHAQHTQEKNKLAQKALPLLRPESVLYMDSGTTLYAFAELLSRSPVTPLRVITPNLPAAELLSTVPGIEVILLGGRLLGRQSVLLGDIALRSLQEWRFDLALMSAEAFDAKGIWNSRPEVIELQRAALARSRKHVFLLGASKLGSTAPHFLLPWKEVHRLFSTAPLASIQKADLPRGAQKKIK